MKTVKNINYNASAKTIDRVFGTFAILASLAAPIPFFVAAAIAGATEDNVGTFGRVLLGGVMFTVIWMILGIRAFIRSERSRKYSDLLAGGDCVKIPHVVRNIGRPLRDVSSDLNALMKRGYFKEMTIDLDYKQVVFGFNDPLPESETEAKTMYEMKKTFPIWGFIVSFATLFPFATLANIPSLVVGFVLAILASLLVSKFFPRTVYFVEVVRTEPRLKRPVLTGVSDFDSMMVSIHDNKCELLRLSQSISSPSITESLGDILRVVDEITEYIAAHPDKYKNLRQYANYYLPTTVDLLRNYAEFDAKPESLKGENIRAAMAKIEGVTANMAGEFKRVYDELYADKAMDISAEVAVMQSIIKENRDIK
ncbi:MAG: 5-bromo-4-chloroindolyl phosphate hydrolysis family protein [Oscillospiraceae bacterium]|nr:5-bromo-4-chloroindolyl phosphate hydrolysis family protein [Oscillospiraceae bacterium]